MRAIILGGNDGLSDSGTTKYDIMEKFGGEYRHFVPDEIFRARTTQLRESGYTSEQIKAYLKALNIQDEDLMKSLCKCEEHIECMPCKLTRWRRQWYSAHKDRIDNNRRIME